MLVSFACRCSCASLMLRLCASDVGFGVGSSGRLRIRVLCPYRESRHKGLSDLRQLFRLTQPERLACDDYWFGNSRDWAICVGTKGPRVFPCGRPLDEGVQQEEPYIAAVREEASTAQEPVLAVLSLSLMEWRIDGHPVRAAKHSIVACRPGFRARDGTAVMANLFKMIMTRLKERKVALTAASGIPNYYRRHGFELAIRYGPGFTTFCCEAPPGTDDSLISREATPADTAALIRLDRINTNASALCASVSDEVMKEEYKWNLGSRGPGWESVSARRHVPAFVLERAGQIAAAWFFYAHPHVARPDDCKIIVRRLLFDPDEDLADLARSIVPHVVASSKRLVEDEAVSGAMTTGMEEEAARAAAKQAQLVRVSWHLSEEHPIMEHIVAEKVARKEVRGTTYLFSSDWWVVCGRFDLDADFAFRWVAIPSLLNFVLALKPVLETRVAASSSAFGTAFKGNLRISTYETAFPGVVIVIEGGKVEARAKSFTHDAIVYAPRPGDQDSEIPNLIAPRGPLTQLLMGYLSLEDLRRTTPDLSVTDDATALLKVLFPTVTKSVMHTYAW